MIYIARILVLRVLRGGMRHYVGLQYWLWQTRYACYSVGTAILGCARLLIRNTAPLAVDGGFRAHSFAAFYK